MAGCFRLDRILLTSGTNPVLTVLGHKSTFPKLCHQDRMIISGSDLTDILIDVPKRVEGRDTSEHAYQLNAIERTSGEMGLVHRGALIGVDDERIGSGACSSSIHCCENIRLGTCEVGSIGRHKPYQCPWIDQIDHAVVGGDEYVPPRVTDNLGCPVLIGAAQGQLQIVRRRIEVLNRDVVRGVQCPGDYRTAVVDM